MTDAPARLRYHFSGIAGAGMNPLAQLMKSRGHLVQGSDRSFDRGQNAGIAARLRELGLELVPHDGSAIRPGLDRFVLEMPLNIAGQANGGFIPPRSVLFERLHHDPVEVAADGAAKLGRLQAAPGGDARQAGAAAEASARPRWILVFDESQHFLPGGVLELAPF